MNTPSLLIGLFAPALLTGAADAQTPWVAVDVGHSLAAPGARAASGTHEFSYNRDLALALDAALAQQGIAHKLIGADGGMKDLYARTPTAEGAALYLSLHHDSVQPQLLPDAAQYSGYALLISHRNPYPDKSQACAARIGDALQGIGRAPTLHHAAPIAGENHAMADRARGIYWYDDLVVLRTARQPAVLVETAVIVNPQEEKLAASPHFRAAMATALARAVSACLQDLGAAPSSSAPASPP